MNGQVDAHATDWRHGVGRIANAEQARLPPLLQPVEADREELEKCGLTVIGIYGMQDPLRPEIKDAVIKCHSAGITIRMVTGDNLDTAKAIAIDAGILTQEEADDTYNRPYAFMEG